MKNLETDLELLKWALFKTNTCGFILTKKKTKISLDVLSLSLSLLNVSPHSFFFPPGKARGYEAQDENCYKQNMGRKVTKENILQLQKHL